MDRVAWENVGIHTPLPHVGSRKAVFLPFAKSWGQNRGMRGLALRKTYPVASMTPPGEEKHPSCPPNEATWVSEYLTQRVTPSWFQAD